MDEKDKKALLKLKADFHKLIKQSDLLKVKGYEIIFQYDSNAEFYTKFKTAQRLLEIGYSLPSLVPKKPSAENSSNSADAG